MAEFEGRGFRLSMIYQQLGRRVTEDEGCCVIYLA